MILLYYAPKLIRMPVLLCKLYHKQKLKVSLITKPYPDIIQASFNTYNIYE